VRFFPRGELTSPALHDTGRLSRDSLTYPPPDRGVALNLGAAALFAVAVILAVAFNWVAAKGVLVVAFLSLALAYLLQPLVRLVRRACVRQFNGWRPARVTAVLLIYMAAALIVGPIWLVWGGKIVSQVPDVAGEVPLHVSRFASKLRATEGWHEQFRFEQQTRARLRRMTVSVSQGLQADAAVVGAEIVRARLIVPWLAAVPLIAFALMAQWPAVHRSAARVPHTPHVQWRVDELLRQVNVVLAAYTRAQALSALIVGLICGTGFVLMQLPNAAMFGIVAGLLEAVPIVGPLAVAISAISVAPASKVLLVLVFLGGVRLIQDYVIYPRLIRRTMHLHPIAVVSAIWCGAVVGGVVGVLLAVPTVGVLQVAWRQYRDYRQIERLVQHHEALRRRTFETDAPRAR
jgi:predicted PurR-regulated permease PerM